MIPDDELAHLHVHTEYSLLDGSIGIPELLDHVKSLGHKAVAITDHGALYGAIELYLKAKDKGLKAIIGCEIFHPGVQPASNPYHLVVLAKSQAGYKNLIKLVSDGFLKGLRGSIPVVPEAVLDATSGDLIALSSCLRGEFGTLVTELRRLAGAGPMEFAPAVDTPAYPVAAALAGHVRAMRSRFGEDGYYVELINNNLPEQKRLLPDLVEAARHFGLPLIASADAHYLDKSRANGHAVLLGIKHGLTMSKIRGRRKSTQFHLFDNDEMRRLYGAWPEALANIRKVVDLCNVKFEFGKYYLPKFQTGREESPEAAMGRLAKEMLEERFVKLAQVYGPRFDDAERQRYRERLEFETQVINKMGFASYFLIVQDFINWAKDHGIPVGPGRGSGAGSLVAYALRITDLDPLPYNLLFERFLNPDRVSMPDFDVDFCQDRRDEVIRYVTAKYGQECVAQITTFGRMNAKAAIRDVGRVLELGFTRVDRIARLIPEPPPALSLDEAMAQEPKIAEEAARDESVAELIRLAKELEGLARHVSVHAAGVVISDGPMTDYVPVYVVDGSPGLITQFEMKMAEKVGLVKFDFLGLKTLTVIAKAVELIRRKKQRDFDIALIPMEDRKVYQYLSAGHTVGVFQLESSGMRNLVLKLKPSCFEDMIALVALFRPGPLGSGMVDDFIACKHGREIVYPLPQLEQILKETYGVMLYQEQVMKVAGELASYSLGEADLLRRAMGKKNAAEMEKQKSRFVAGAVANGHPEAKSAEIFDLMAKFADYGFNKSHSAAYGLIAYQTGFLKVHYPEEFMAAIMTCDLGNTAKIVRYVDDCRRLRIKVKPPCINRSGLEFEVPGETPRGVIEFGLAAVKGIGPQAVKPLVDDRLKKGPFKNLADLARRVDLKQVGKKTLELLGQCGALDVFGISRPKLMELISEVVRFSEVLHEAKGSGQRGLFDAEPEDAQAAQDLSWVLSVADRRVGAPTPEWLKKEKALLGVYLTGHPLEFHREDQRAFGKTSTADLPKLAGSGKKIPMVVLLAAANERQTKTGRRMASFRLEDEHGAIEALAFDDDIPKESPPAGTVVVATLGVDTGFDGSLRIKLERIAGVEEVRAEHVKAVTLKLTPTGGQTSKPAEHQTAITDLATHFSRHPGDTPVSLVVRYDEAEVHVALDKRQVELNDSFLHGLGLLPFAAAELRYQLYGAP